MREGFAAPVDHMACHRLAVFDQEGGKDGVGGGMGGGASTDDLADLCGGGLQLTNIVSQSDILRFLHKHCGQLGDQLLGSTLEQVRRARCGRWGW